MILIIDEIIIIIKKEHADLYHLCLEELFKVKSELNNNGDKTLTDYRIRQIDPLYYDTIRMTLEAIKVLKEFFYSF